MKPFGAGLFGHCPACGAPAPGGGEARGQRFACPACGFLYHFNPPVGVAPFLVDGAGRVLFTRRQHDPGQGLLGLPGGFVDFGERAEDAVRREAREEIGLEIGDLTFLSSHPNSYPYKGIVYPVLDLFFVARVASFDGAKPLSEVTELVIRRADEVNPDEIAFPSMRAAWKDFLLSQA
ncbi:MAG TPA: NUDIX domain-containing protein [Candidatus Methylacidiphilales bacterium]